MSLHHIIPLVLTVCLTLAGCTATTPAKPAPKAAPARTEGAAAQKRAEDQAIRKPEAADKVPPAETTRKAEQELGWGVRNYEEGQYQNAALNFQNALEAGLLSSGDQVKAHKYLAFIYCVSGEKMACRAEFRKAFAINPRFELTPAEAGHPIWGPIFREVKAQSTVRKKK